MTKGAAAATFAVISAATWAAAASSTSPPAPDWPAGRVVLGLIGPERLAVVHVATGQVTTRRLAGGTLCHGPLMASAGHAVWLGSARRTPVAMAQDLGLERRVRTLGPADLALPAGEGRVWLARLRYGRIVRAVSVRRVAIGGTTLMLSRHRAPAGYPEAATERALVIARGRRALLWEPATGHVQRAPGTWLMASHGRRSAWCSEGCARARLAGPKGVTRSTELPGRTHVVPRGSFSARGRMLALASTLIGGGPPQIELVNVRTGHAELVPGATLSDSAAFDWAPSGGWLYFVAPGGRLRAYRPADGRTVTLPGRWPRDVLSLAASG